MAEVARIWRRVVKVNNSQWLPFFVWKNDKEAAIRRNCNQSTVPDKSYRNDGHSGPDYSGTAVKRPHDLRVCGRYLAYGTNGRTTPCGSLPSEDDLTSSTVPCHC